jgi:hypothetical protein
MNRISPLVVVVATAVTGALVLLDVNTPARIPLVLAFALTVPGLGWASRMRLPDTGDALLLAVTISVCLLVIVGEGMALLGIWSVEGGFLVLAAVALLGVGLPRPRHRQPGAAATDTKMADGEKVDPAHTGQIAWPVPPWAADTGTVAGEK